MKKIQQRPIQSYIFAGIVILLLLAVFRLVAPFFSPLLWSTLLYIMFSPLHRRLIKKLDFNTLKGKILRNLWAGIFTIGTLILIVFPLLFAGRLFLTQIIELGRLIIDFINEKPEFIHEFFEKISGFISDASSEQFIVSASDIEAQFRTIIINEIQNIISLSSSIVQNIVSTSLTMLLNLLIMTFSMFFFYVDGPYLSRLVLKAVPIRGDYISTLTKKFKDITRNLFMGYIIVALLQSTVAFIIFTIFGIKGSLVLSVLTFILVFIPMFGATIIYIPITIILILSGKVAAGIIFFIVSVIFISGIDNILRPFFLKDRIQLHPLIIFFAILGGLFVFGFNGFVLGPMLVIFFLTALDMFLTEHKIGNPESLQNTASQESEDPQEQEEEEQQQEKKETV